MFYCEECRLARDWPDSMSRSRGKCELCGNTRTCHDVPSSALPLPPVRVTSYVDLGPAGVSDVEVAGDAPVLEAFAPATRVLSTSDAVSQEPGLLMSGPGVRLYGFDLVLDPCPSCHAPMRLIHGQLVGTAELFAPDGPPGEEYVGHIRPHTTDCTDRTASDAHPGTRTTR